MSLRLAMVLIALTIGAVRGVASDALRRADSLLGSGDFAAAAELYRTGLAQATNELSLGNAQFGLGCALLGQKDYEHAITNFQAIVQNNLGVYRLYLHRSAWLKIAESQLAAKAYREALESVAEAEKQRIRPFCGNAIAESDAQVDRFRGIIFEHLGDYTNALRIYVRLAFDNPLIFAADSALALRIVDIYESAGQLPKLASLLTEMEALKQKRSMFPSRLIHIMRRTIELRNVAAGGRTSELTMLLTKPGGSVSIDEERDWELMEIVRLLSANPSESVPALIRTAEFARVLSETKLPYALGRSGSTTALNWLKRRALMETNSSEAEALVFGILVAGEAARPMFTEVRRAGARNPVLAEAVRSAATWNLMRLSTVRRAGADQAEFPSEPAKGDLPGSLKDLGLN